jgi:D-aminopeptidase
LHRHRADPGHNFALRQEPVAHQTLAAFLVQKMRVSGHETSNFGLNCCAKQFLGSSLNDLGQRVR